MTIAFKDLEQKPADSAADESDLILKGYVAFLDPPKDSTAPAIKALIVTTTVIMMIGVWLPFSPIAPSLGFKPLPSLYWPLLALTLLCYVFLTQGVKVWLWRKAWI